MNEPGQDRAPESSDDGDRRRGAAVSADVELPALDERALDALRAVGEEWNDRIPGADEACRALPIDPDLRYLTEHGSQRGRFIHIRSARAEGPEELEATQEGATPDSSVGRAEHLVRRLFIGAPLRSTAVAEERMGKLLSLAVLAPDALSSVAYGPEAMLAILVLAGSAELKLSLPIGGVLVALMLSVGLGYRQVIRAYPNGGGSYIVASDSLGSRWGLLAGAGLIVDYILTVAVSVAAGVAAVTSAVPSLSAAAVPLGLAVILLLVLSNLRGTRSAGAAFVVPTCMFVAAIALIVIVGLVKSASHGFHVTPAPPHHATEAIGVLLILRAFASGATATTGIEVISNAVPVFKPPEADNARQALGVMLTVLVSMFIGVLVVAHLFGIAPAGQTVLSQIAHRSVGSGLLYDFVQLATTLVLLIAANSAMNGFPRLLYFMARDSFAPRAFLHLGDRLAFSLGIIVLAVPAAVLYAGFDGQTNPLIPLYAIGVFVAFTLAQSGMVRYWTRHHDAHWRRGLAINLVGALMSGAVAVIAAITKFTAGAWVVVILIPLIVFACLRVHAHYTYAREALIPRPGNGSVAPRASSFGPSRAEAGQPSSEVQDQPNEVSHLMVVPVAVLDLSALRALAYAASLEVPTLALHISPSPEEAERFHRQWDTWGDHLPLRVVVSPYRATLAPLANYIEALHRQRPDVTLTVVVPQLVARRRWQRLLHNRHARRLRRMLIAHEGIVITSIPFHLSR